jgi:hypothetical protein
MFEAAVHIHDKDMVNRENVIGDDEAQVCAGVLDPVEALEIHQQAPATDQTSRPLQDINSVSYSYVVDENQYINHLNTEQKQVRNEEDMALYIESVAGVFNVDVKEYMEMAQKWRS